MFYVNNTTGYNDTALPPSLNPDVKYERPFRPASELMFSGYNKRNTYSNDSISVGDYDREGRHLYR